MKCEKCGFSKSIVLETNRKSECVVRLRSCKKCGHKFKTVEMGFPVFHTTLAHFNVISSQCLEINK